MKQTILITLLFSFCIACSKDDDGGATNDSQLVSGKWYFESNNGVEGQECDKICSIEFTSNGQFIIDAYGVGEEDCMHIYLMEGTYTVSGNTINVNVYGVTASGTYNITNGLLITNGINPFDSSSNNTTYDKTPG